MGKEGDLWDDSALIKAFDTSISNYKTMHGMSGSTTGEKSVESSEFNLAASEADNGNKVSCSYAEHVQNDGKRCIATETTAKIGETTNMSPRELGSSNIRNGNHLSSNENEAAVSNVKGQNETAWNSDGTEYSNLLNKYYELEDQRQKVLQQLNQYNSWNYAHPDSSKSKSEVYPACVPQPYDTVNCYCSYGCQNWVLPFNALPAPCSSGSCIDKSCTLGEGCQNGNPASGEDSDFVKTGLIAAERALSSLKEEASGGKEKKLGTEGHFPQSTKSTDLDVVLNAWYSAGFHTGKLEDAPIDPMLDIIASKRISFRPERPYERITVLNIDLDLLAARIKNRLKLIIPGINNLRFRYCGLTETEIDQAIEDGIDMMVDRAIAICYNRLRAAAGYYAPDVLVNRMMPKAPVSSRHVFPMFVASLLSSIGPLRVKDGPEDMLVIYATQTNRMQNYGRANSTFDFRSGIFFRFTENLGAIGIDLAPIDVDVTHLSTGSFFSTIIPSLQNGVWNLSGTVHHSHYVNEDIVRAYLAIDNDVSLRPFEYCGMVIGECTDTAVTDAIAAAQQDTDGATASTLPIGMKFNTNILGIRPAVAAQGGEPAIPAAAYIVGRGDRRFYSASLAADIYDHEMWEMLRFRILHHPLVA